MQYSFISASETENHNLSFWQSQIWQSILIESNQAQEVFYFGNIQSTFLLVEVRSIGFWFFGAFSLGVSGAQIGTDWKMYLRQLCSILREKWVAFLQIEPIDPLPGVMGGSSKKPYKKFLTPYTRYIDLTLSEEEILSQMHEKWRYNIRLASKKWVRVEEVHCNEENLDIWMWLLRETLDRDGFSGNSKRYYEVFIKNLEINNQWWLFFAWFEWRVIAAGIFVFTSERAIYYYGASSSKPMDRNIFSPYLLQWEMMKLAKSKNIWIYDFLGVSDPNIVNDSLAWVTFFKSRFGGTLIELPKKILIAISWRYIVVKALQKIKNLLKRR